MYKNVKVIGAAIIAIVAGVAMVSATQRFDIDELRGSVFYSTGADLYKYDFSTGGRKVLFNRKEGLASNREISNAVFPNYLKSKNKIALIGYGITYGSSLFECDLNGNNWKEYKNLKNIGELSISPDETKFAFHRHPNQLIIREYKDLEKDDAEKIIAEDSCRWPCLWKSDEEIFYYDINENTVLVNIKSGERTVVFKGVRPTAISKDGKHLIYKSEEGNKNKIYLVDLTNYSKRPLMQSRLFYSGFFIWSPDGRYFLFNKTSFFRSLIYAFMGADARDIWIYDIKTGKKQIFEKNASFHNGFWVVK